MHNNMTKPNHTDQCVPCLQVMMVYQIVLSTAETIAYCIDGSKFSNLQVCSAYCSQSQNYDCCCYFDNSRDAKQQLHMFDRLGLCLLV